MDEMTLLKMIAALGIGLSVGGGIMILALSKWGRRILQGERGEPGMPGATTCPFAGDHPKLQEFMGESLQDRKNMRGFLEDINHKVNGVGADIGSIKGKLDLLLQGARVRWNSGLIPQEKDK